MRGKITYVKRDILLKFHVKFNTRLISRHTKLKFAKQAIEKYLKQDEERIRKYNIEEYGKGVNLETKVKRIISGYRIIVKDCEYVPGYYPSVSHAAKKHGLN